MKQAVVVLSVVVIIALIGWLGFLVGQQRAANAPMPEAAVSASPVRADTSSAAQTAGRKVTPSSRPNPATAMVSSPSANRPTRSDDSAKPVLAKNSAQDSSAQETHDIPKKSDAELLNDFVSPTGKPDDEFNSSKVMHNRLITEPRDDDWAAQAEQQLRNFIVANMGAERLNIVAVTCASTLCEIEAIGRAPDNLSADMEDFQKYIFMMPRQAWWTEYQFNEPRCAVMSTPDQRAMFVAFITRRQADSAG